MIAAQLYTVRDRLHDRRQLVEVLGRLRETGYEGVEVASLGPDAADHFSEELTRAASSMRRARVAGTPHRRLVRGGRPLPRLGMQVRGHPERAAAISLSRRIQTLRAG